MSDHVSRIDWLSPQQLADELGVSVETVRRWVRTGGGPPPVRLGPHTVRFRRSDIQAWLPPQAAVTGPAAACEVVAAGGSGAGRPGVLELVTDLVTQAQLLDALIRSAESPSGADRVVVELDAAAWSSTMQARATAGHHTPLDG